MSLVSSRMSTSRCPSSLARSISNLCSRHMICVSSCNRSCECESATMPVSRFVAFVTIHASTFESRRTVAPVRRRGFYDVFGWLVRRVPSFVRSFVHSFGADERSSITNSVVVSSAAAPFLALCRRSRGGPTDRGPKGIVAAASVRVRASVVSCYRFSAESRALFSLSPLSLSFARARAGCTSCCGKAFSQHLEG